MAIGTPTVLGSIGNAGTSGPLAIPTGANMATDDVVVVWHYANATGGLLPAANLTDNSGNVYKRILSAAGSAPLAEIFICTKAIAMASGGAITASGFSGSARQGLYAVSLSGLVNVSSVYDPHTGTAASIEKSTGVSSPPLPINAVAAAQMIVLTMTAQGSALGAYTPTPGFTALTPLVSPAWMYPEYKILSAVGAGNSNPSWATGTTAHFTASIGLVGIPANNNNRQSNLALIGVGA